MPANELTDEASSGVAAIAAMIAFRAPGSETFCRPRSCNSEIEIAGEVEPVVASWKILDTTLASS